MTIAISATKRAKGRLYVQVRLSDDATDCLLRASAVTSDGSHVPVRVLQGEEEGEWLLAMPSLTVTQVVTMQALGWDGTVVEEQTQRFNPLASRIVPPSISLRRGARASGSLKVPDARSTLGEWDVVVLRLVQAPDDQEICQGYANLVGSGRDALEGPVAIKALDARGHDVLATSWVCLDDTVAQLAGHTGFYLRHVEFSLRIPASVPMLVVCVEPLEVSQDNVAAQDGLPTGFSCLEPRTMASLREAWKVLATAAEDDETYDTWYHASHAATEAELAMQQADSFDRATSFSVVCVVRDAAADDLRAMVDSVLAQSYGHLELVLVNAAPNNRRLGSVVRGLELADARVHCVPLGADFGVAAATSEGVDAATGDFVCLLGEGDALAPDALWCLAEAVEANPRADLLYTDEDCLEKGRHVQPTFKPEWDPDLLLGTNYVGGLMAVRRSLLRDMATMDRELDGAQGHYLALYASVRAREVCHVPRVLYHACQRSDRSRGTTQAASGLVALRRHLAEVDPLATPRASARVHQGYEISYDLSELEPAAEVFQTESESFEPEEQEVESAAEQVVEEASREDVESSVEPAPHEGESDETDAPDGEAADEELLADEVEPEADDSAEGDGEPEADAAPALPLVSVIIPNRDRVDSLDRCLTSLLTLTTYARYEVIVVENGSVDPRTFAYYREAEARDARVKTIFYQQDVAFDEARLVNFGASRAQGAYLLLVHNDVEVTDGEWMGRLVSLCARRGTGAAAARLVRADGTIESSGMHLTPDGPVADGRYLPSRANERAAAALLHGVTMASGSCLMVDAAAFAQLGGMQERYPARFCDADLCLRLWGSGLRVVLDPKIELIHHRPLVAEDCGSGTAADIRAIGRLWESWPFGLSPCDPTVGPNLDRLSAYRALPA